MKTIAFEYFPTDLKEILNKYFPEGRKVREYYLTHVIEVTKLAFQIAERKKISHLDKEYLLYGGILHDIGIIKTDAPTIDCHGKYPYIAHTYLGREILEENGFAQHAAICERHIGVGITAEEIKNGNLPLPPRDMLPISIEEKIICYADKFYSKSNQYLKKMKPREKIRKSFAKRGDSFLLRWDELDRRFQ